MFWKKKKKANGRIKHCLSVVGLAAAKGKAGQEKKKANLKQLKSLRRITRNSGIRQLRGIVPKEDQNSGHSPQTNRILILRHWTNKTEKASALRNRNSARKAELWPIEGISDTRADTTKNSNGVPRWASSTERSSPMNQPPRFIPTLVTRVPGSPWGKPKGLFPLVWSPAKS